MTRKKKIQESKVEAVIEDLPAEPKPVPTKPTPVFAQRKARLISFEAYANSIKIPTHHRKGMKAFIPNSNTPRPATVWASLLAKY